MTSANLELTPKAFIALDMSGDLTSGFDLQTNHLTQTFRRSDAQPWRMLSSLLRARLTRTLYGVEQRVRRAIDFTAALSGVICLSPLFIAIAIAIKLESPGPVFFVQKRVGRRGRTFRMLKFRSMCENAEAQRDDVIREEGATNQLRFKSKSDRRVTRIGGFLRKSSLDEMPQLWNIVRNEMTLVGPRPPIPKETSEYTALEWRRLDVTPGLTCLWQVGGRADIPFSGQVLLDVEYIERRSILLDIKILAATVPAVLRGKGAY